jgi:hypothetical protein
VAFDLAMAFQMFEAEGHELDFVCDVCEGLRGVSHAMVQSLQLDRVLGQLNRQRRKAGATSNHAEYDFRSRHVVGRRDGSGEFGGFGVKVIRESLGAEVRTAQPDLSSASPQLCSYT